MIVANFASVPPGSICRPVTKQWGDNFHWHYRETWDRHIELRFSQWMGRWQVDVRATKRAKVGKK